MFNHLYKGAIIRLRDKAETKHRGFSNQEYIELNKLLCKANKKGVPYEELCSILNSLVDDSQEGTVQSIILIYFNLIYNSHSSVVFNSIFCSLTENTNQDANKSREMTNTENESTSRIRIAGKMTRVAL